MRSMPEAGRPINYRLQAALAASILLVVLLSPAIGASASRIANHDIRIFEKTEGQLVQLASHAAAISSLQLDIVVELAGDEHALAEEIAALGFEIESVHGRLLQVRASPQGVARLAELDSVLFVKLPASPIVLDVVSEGVATIGADKVQQAGRKGFGVKVAVLDVGFDVQNPEIASNIAEARSFRRDRNIQGATPEDKAHGTGVSEILVDVAPGVRLYLLNFNTEVEYLNAVDYAIQLGVSIISTSIGWANVGPLDGTSDISRAADLARSKGIVFVSAAGNEARRHWSGTFRDVNGDGVLAFQGTDQQNSITVRTGQQVEIFVSWDDWPRSVQDYDLFLLDSNLNVVASSQTIQGGFSPPAEQIVLNQPNPGTYHIQIKKTRATRNSFFQLFVFTQDLQYFVSEGSIVIPGDARGAITIGATYFVNDSLEFFSSRGPTIDSRIKPDLTGPDGVSTSAFGPRAFFGSSASTPHVSGAAALILGNSTFTAGALQQLLESTAKDLATPGKDSLTGAGRVDVIAATKVPDFELSLSPNNQTALVGTTLAYAVLVRSLNAFAGQVTLAIFGLPVTATATITPNPVILRAGTQQSALLSVRTINSTSLGRVAFQVVGTSGQLSHAVNGEFFVTPNISTKVKLTVATNPRVAGVAFRVDAVEQRTNSQGTIEVLVDPGTHTIGLVRTSVSSGNRSLTFTSWSGAASGSANPVSVRIANDSMVTANFSLIIPGFPVESILLGVLVGVVSLALLRRRTRRNLRT